MLLISIILTKPELLYKEWTKISVFCRCANIVDRQIPQRFAALNVVNVLQHVEYKYMPKVFNMFFSQWWTSIVLLIV